ncbi:MAG: PVC-type heme-binding CxxCH protein, partial [Pirellula sp.]
MKRFFSQMFLCCLALGGIDPVAGQDSPPPLRLSKNVPSLNVAEGLELDLVLQEPQVANPLYLNFDERGRLWVVQYRQYPWPAGLKLISRDNVWRNVYQPPFPPPPPQDENSPFRGKDMVTIHEDTDGDGVFEKQKIFLDGLNLATAALKGRGGVFVLNPPYLLFYEDKDNDDTPDSLNPQILLSGFGIEDTHSISNSLRWGPDGWIYGTQGSTVSAAVVRLDQFGQPIAGESPIHSMGQNVWRYHPEQRKYEIFAEGGGNAFGVEFDSAGRVYSGHNGGDTRGFHYVPGGYYLKNFGKHGLHSNPFTYAYYGAMRHHTVERFTHTFEIYEADALPAQYHGKLISISPILHYVMASTISSDGSTRKTKDIGPVITAGGKEKDDWFTPVDIQTGPDGAIYLADWYSMQSTHYRNHEGQTNPDLGRVYRLRSDNQRGYPVLDMSASSSRELVEKYLSHSNRWFRETALR